MTLFTITIFIFLAAVIRQLLAIHTFFKYLEEAHPKTYQALGYPRWRIQFGDVVLRNAIRYIHDKGFESLGDVRLGNIYRSIKIAERIAYTAAAFAVMISIYEVIKPMLGH